MTAVNTSLPVVTGNRRQGQTLHVSDGEWTYASDTLEFDYEWRRCDAAGANCVAIGGATSPYYVLQAADVGVQLRAAVAATEVSFGSTTPNPPAPTITTINDVVIGLNIGNDPQSVWDDYDISFTADSGVIMGPVSGDPSTTLRRFKLRTIGARSSGHPDYAVHGIYCKRPNTLLQDIDAEVAPGAHNADGISIRRSGIVVDRFRTVSQVDFAMSYFEEDPETGLVTVQNGTGFADSGYGMWVGLNTEATVRQEFLFTNVHFTIGSAQGFIGCSPGEYSGPGITIDSCTLNGAPVTSGMVDNISPVTIL